MYLFCMYLFCMYFYLTKTTLACTYSTERSTLHAQSEISLVAIDQKKRVGIACSHIIMRSDL